MAGKEKSDSAKTSESKSLKTGNMRWLLAVTAANLVVFSVLTAIDPEPLSKLAKSWEFILPAGAGLALICVINGLLSGEAKSRLVFWKWQNPLPGHEAYTVHAKNDPRFSQADVVEKLRLDRETMNDPKKQNAHWYRNVFTPTQDAPSVEQANRNWLFTRDYAAMSLMMLFVLGTAGYFIITPVIKWLIYVAGLIAQYLLVLWVARNYGVETVTNAIAVKTATPTSAAETDIT
jgi:hypothetical protein